MADDLTSLCWSARLAGQSLMVDGRRSVLGPDNAPVAVIYQNEDPQVLRDRATYFAELHNAFVAGRLVVSDRSV